MILLRACVFVMRRCNSRGKIWNIVDSLGLFALPNEKSADGQSRLDGWIGQTDELSLLRFDGRSGSVISTRGDILMYFAAGSIRNKAHGYLYDSSSLPHRKGKLVKISCRIQIMNVLSPKPRKATEAGCGGHAPCMTP